MIEDIKEFFTNNSTMVIMAILALVSIVAIFMFRRGSGTEATGQVPYPTPSHDLDGMESMASVCDMTSGMCHSPEQMAQMSQEQEQQMMMQQQMIMQQMQEQQGGEQEQGQGQ